MNKVISLGKNVILVLVIMLSISKPMKAQNIQLSHYPEVGKPCPDFKLRNIKYYKKTEVSLKDFKGKWLILDFFTSHCGACIQSFPHVNEQAKEAGDKLVYMMVGSPDKQIEPMYTAYRKKMGLVMPFALDGNLFSKWAVGAVPRLFIIDDKGIVRMVTSALSKKQLQTFLAGGDPTFVKASAFVSDLVSSILYGSAISKFDPSNQKFTSTVSWEPHGAVKINFMQYPLYMLVNYACWGVESVGNAETDSTCFKYAASPVVRSNDSTLFHFSDLDNENVFNYTLKLPADRYSIAEARKQMRQDLCNYFGWNITTENIEQPCWALVVSDSLKLAIASRGGARDYTMNKTTMRIALRNVPFDYLFKAIRTNLPFRTILLNLTGISGSIDIRADGNAPWPNIVVAKENLRKIGFDLVPVQRAMRTLVIYEASNKEKSPSDNQFSGVRFEDGLNWQQALDKAKAENKNVFVYGYSRQSNICSYIDSIVFPSAIVGDYFSDKFVSLRYDIDDASNSDAKMISDLFGAKQYPAFLFFSAEGKPLHLENSRKDPIELINVASKSADPNFQYYTLLDQYRKGEKDPNKVYAVFRMASDRNQPVITEIGRDYIRRFILSRPKDSPWSFEDIDLVTSLQIHGDELGSTTFYEYREPIALSRREPYYVEKTITGQIIDHYTSQARKESKDAPDWKMVSQEIQKACPDFDGKPILLSRQISWYEFKKDWPEYGQYAIRYMELSGSSVRDDQINSLAWNIFLYCKDKSVLQKAIDWSKKTVVNSKNYPVFLDTYAQLLYKAFFLYKIIPTDDYLEIESRVVELLKDEETQNNYLKMKQGLPTWEN